MPYRVFLVEDHPIVSEAMAELIALDASLELVGTAADGQEALAALREADVDLVIADISIPTLNGLELTRALLAEDASTRVLIVSGHQGALYTRQAQEAGACGFVTKAQVVSNLLPTLHEVLGGAERFVHA